MTPHLLALTLALTGPLAARSFMDVSGKIIEAEFVSLADGVVTISKDGKPFKLPLARFSAADQAFLQKQAGNSPAPAPAAASKLQLAGKDLTRGGTINSVEAPLTEETLKKTRKNKDVTGLKIGIALPDNFDPAAPQKILWVSAAINNDAERKAGNLSVVGMYAKTAVPEGWVVIAVDSNLGNARKQDNEEADVDMPIQHQVAAMLSAAWPGFAKSTFACAGFSGGAKASFYRVGQLATANLHVAGLFLGGCNENLTEASKTETKVRGGALRQVNVFVSNGKTDNIATVAMGKSVGDVAEKDFAQVRIETYDGGHSLSAEHLKTALKWFVESAKPAAK